MDHIIERNEVAVDGQYDVVVIGGGVAGISAALAAKRLGSKVLLIEKSICLGGLATIGLINYYEPLCDGRGTKIMGGIAEELLELSLKYGYGDIPDNWKASDKKTAHMPSASKSFRYATFFSPEALILALDELMETEGVEVLFDTLVVKPVMQDKKCTHIIVENKAGRYAIKAHSFVDASGDLDIMHRAGAETQLGENWLTYSYKYTNSRAAKIAADENKSEKAVKTRTVGCTFTGKATNDKGPMNRKFNGTDPKEISEFVTLGRKMVLDRLKKSGCKDTLITLPTMAQFRTTRRLKGIFELKEEHKGRTFYDSIGCVSDFTKNGPVYEVPYRALLSEDIDNIITAGRTVSSIGHAWEVTRVIPCAAATGQAAGTAAALACSEKITLHDVDIEAMQKTLSDNGIMIHNEKANNK
jgi:hypothetical protein